MSELTPRFEPLQSGDFPFPLAGPTPEPVMISRPCGCTSMVTEPDDPKPIQVSWCVRHDPGYEPPEDGPCGHCLNPDCPGTCEAAMAELAESQPDWADD